MNFIGPARGKNTVQEFRNAVWQSVLLGIVHCFFIAYICSQAWLLLHNSKFPAQHLRQILQRGAATGLACQGVCLSLKLSTTDRTCFAQSHDMTPSCFLLCDLQAKASAAAEVEEEKPEKVEVVKADAKVRSTMCYT